MAKSTSKKSGAVQPAESNNTIAAEAAPEEHTVSTDIQNESITDDTTDTTPASDDVEPAEVAEPTLDDVEQGETPTEDLTYVVDGHAYTPDEVAAMSDGQLYDLIGQAKADADGLKVNVDALAAERAEARDDYEHDFKVAQRKQLKDALAAFDAETAGILAVAGTTAAPALIAVLQERNPKLAATLSDAPVAARPAGSRGPRHDLAPTVLGLCVDGTTLPAINKQIKALGGSVMSPARFALTYAKYTVTDADGNITLSDAGRDKLVSLSAE